ncbi:argininosuccinate lyase [Caldimicrobium thiodismutans]|uniref:Argininosuccinate lyase n=1 Tax=Caldimicrobium thiodismutans TaxID=1653476 RepID=A0A0U5AH14_9BACT|nr:argininosuccinate lyase [Caldimicrobium thiodismutans]BAU23255.1 argininosuccinate lyase [Caldimicrobium thiodismutans]
MLDKAWGGRFREETDKFFEEFTESVSFDKILAFAEIKASLVYGKALLKAGILTREEYFLIEKGLLEIEKEIKEGCFVFKVEQEDVHMNLEKALFERIGDIAYKLHTGRSRNEQVVTDLRLYLMDEGEKLKILLLNFIETLITKAEAYMDVVMPGFTHLQHAQPVLFSHWISAYAEGSRLHFERLLDWEKRLKLSPLGSSAFAGCGFPLDRTFMAKELGFSAPHPHSVYAVSSRDFSAEFLFILTLIMLDLSRLSEELILWMTPEFAFIDLPDRFCSGSSIMPQKKNPDSAELIRGKGAIVLGNLFQLLTLIKNLPLSYNRDLQEDKPPLFQGIVTTQASLKMATLLIEGLKVNQKRIESFLKEGYLLATELADYLVTKGLPFREAHHLTGKIVRFAEERGKKLEELSLAEFQSFSPLITEEIYTWLTIEHSLKRREILGGTGREAVKSYLNSLREYILKWKK